MATNRNPLRNERGFTLIELLATLVLSSIALAILWNIFLTGTGASQRIQQNSSAQHDANLITQSIRAQHRLELPYTLSVTEETVRVGDTVIQSGHTYSAAIAYGGQDFQTGDIIEVTAKTPMYLNVTITDPDTGNQTDVRTTIHTLQREGN